MADGPDILETIFSDTHKPVIKSGHGMYEPGHAVVFPTNKTPSGIVRARTTLMADGLLHLDTDPSVVQLSAFPMEIAYWSTRDGKTPLKRDHVPDVAIQMRDGSIVFIDYVSLNIQRQKRFFRRRVAERVRHFQNELGCAYTVLDERSVRIQPRLSNLRLMWTHRQRPTEPMSLAHAREVIRQTVLPTTIRSISDKASFARQAVRWEGDEEPIFLEETNLIFSAVMQLAMRGEVRFDLGTPLTLDTVVSEVSA